MSKDLTKKEKGFVKDYVETGNATLSALNNYDIQGEDKENIAGAIGSENLTKPKIQTAIQLALPDELLNEKHRKLFEQKQLAYFVFPKFMDDIEIEEHLLANGLDCIVIRPSDKGKLAFYSIDDANAIKSALDMAYKVKGSYAPEKRDITTQGEKLPSTDLDALAEIMSTQLKENKT